MRDVQLFIKGAEDSDYTKVELFGDETISLTQTIKNAQDVSKIFTDYSRGFTVPASKSNNRIFKHYYNFSIDNGFDARKRVDARIEINSIPFKSGRIRLDGVELKDDRPYSYKLTFFGNTIKLKDQLGEEDLSSLDLSANNTVYSAANIKSGLQANPATANLITPLITHSQRLTYGTGAAANSGDLKYDAATDHGLLWSELKYAIRVHAIVQAIAQKAGFTISSDSFFNINNPNYYNLFLWLHRKKGDLQSQILQEPVESQVTGFDGTTQNFNFAYTNASGSEIILNDDRYLTAFSLEVANPSGITYSVSIYRDGELRISRQGVSSANLFLSALSESRTDSSYEVFFSSTAAGSLEFTWTAVLEEPFNSAEILKFNATQGALGDVPFIISQQIPEMKIIDFLSGLFKMFNLVAEINEQNVLTVKTLEEFYEGGASRDITQYIDNSSITVDAAVPYSEIEYKYRSTETILSEQFNQITNREWGSDRYNTSDNLKEGGTFTVEVPFEHMQFERLRDESSGNLTPIMYGYYVDDNQDPYIGAPLLFYAISNPLGTNSISYVTSKDANDNFNATEEITGSVIVPSNSRTLLGSNFETDNLHFYPEGNEYEPNVTFFKTLFYSYHYDYIASLFSFRKRMTTVKAMLPVSVLINYSLADTFLIQGNKYKINSINTNLNTGDSTIQLLNDVVVAKDNYGQEEIPENLYAVISGPPLVQERTRQVYTSTVSGTATGLTTYEWSVGSGGTVIGSSTFSQVEIEWGEVSQDSIRTLRLTVRRTNDGDPQTYTTAPYSVTVQDLSSQPNPDPDPDPTPMSVDILQSGGTPNDAVSEGALRIYDAAVYGDYDTPLTYSWSADGGTITSGQGTSRVYVTWDEIPGDTGSDYNGSIGLSVTSDDSQSDSASYPVRVVDGTTAPYIDVQISGIVSPVEIGTSQTYGTVIDSNINTSNPTLYSWSITGGTINGSNLGSSVNVTWNTEGTGQISVSVVREGESDSDTQNVEVFALETTASITGLTPNALEGQTVTYGSIIGGNTTGPITYDWSVSKGEISGGSYDGNGNSVISGVGIDSVSVTWGNIEIGTGSISLVATRQGRSGSDSATIQILPIYYIFDRCDDIGVVVSRMSTPPVDGQRYVDYSGVNVPVGTYYVWSGAQRYDTAGYDIGNLQAILENGQPTTGCPSAPPPPEEELTITGQTVIDPSGENGIEYDITTLFTNTGWAVTIQPLGGYDGIDATFASSSVGSYIGSVRFNFGPNNTGELQRSIIRVSETTLPATAFDEIVIEQSATPPPPPPTTYYIFNPCDGANSTVMVDLGSAPSSNQRAVGGFDNYYTYSGSTTTNPNLYPIASLSLESATGCPAASNCTRYQALNEGNSVVYFIYTDCTSGGSRLLSVNPLQARDVCAVTGTFEYASGNTNYTINELGDC